MSHSLNIFKSHKYQMQYILNLLIDPDYGVFDNIPLNAFTYYPHIKKAAAKNDPDTPTIKEALFGPHRDKFLEAMSQEIEELEEHGTWNIMERSSLPEEQIF